MEMSNLRTQTWQQRLRLFVFNKQEFMPFTLWHILVYIAIWVLVAYIIIWSGGVSKLKEALLFSIMAVVPGVVAIQQFWRRFYHACITSNKRQAFITMLQTLLHYFFVTAPLWVNMMLLFGAFLAGDDFSGGILWYIWMFFVFWAMLYLFAAVFLLLSFLPILIIASLIYSCINFCRGTKL